MRGDQDGNSAAGGGMRTFFTIWMGQLVSLLGSGLTGFALGVWVYQRTGSVTQFALISVFTTLPSIVLSPLAGALVDRWDRRVVMILSDCAAALGTLAMAVLLWLGRLETWHIYIAMAWSSMANAFQWPAYSAATSLLVPVRQLGRANGLVQLSQAGGQIAAPVVAGLLLAVMHIHGVILIDFASFVFAVGTLLLVRVPAPPRGEEGEAVRGSLASEIRFGWTYISERAGLVRLLVFFAFTNFLAALAVVLVTPLVLAFETVTALGTVLSLASSGMLVGSVVMSGWGGPRKRVYGILGFGLLAGASLTLVGLRPSLPLITAGLFAFLFGIPIINGCSQAIWQSKVAPDIQGRVFAVRRMFATASLPLAYLVAGPLSDRVFEPLMAPGGALSGALGALLGTGTGRGIGLLYIVLGVFSFAVTAWSLASPRLLKVEEELPDALGYEKSMSGSTP